jgi:hypothetical protein
VSEDYSLRFTSNIKCRTPDPGPRTSDFFAPDGSLLAGPVYDEEAILTADLDFSRIAEESLALDVTGHYSRPDIFDVKLR